MRSHLNKFAVVPTALVLAFGVTACDDGGDSTETMVDEEPQEDTSEEPADLEGDVDAGGDDGTGDEADADADVDADGEQDS